LRVAKLTDKFSRSAARLHAVGGETGRKLGRLIRTLESAEVLPAPSDLATLVEADERGVSALWHVRRVPGRNLWVWYSATDHEVTLHALTNVPPG
jgi:hypothetical protein